MSRKRIKQITDIVLSLFEVKRIRKGYRIFKYKNKHTHCIYMEDNAKARKIARLERELRMLKHGEIIPTKENA